MDCSPPGSSVHGIFQARILEWVAVPFSRGSSRPRDRTQVSCTAGRFFSIWATREAQEPPWGNRNPKTLQLWAKWASSSHRRPWTLAVGSNTVFRGKTGKIRRRDPRRFQSRRTQTAQSFCSGGTLPQKIRPRHHDLGLHQPSVNKCQSWGQVPAEANPEAKD